jgi:hypothetical protein
MEDNMMDITNLSDDEEFGSPPKSSIEAQREIIRQSLPGLASEITMLIRDAGLAFPILLCIPNSGNALLTMATPHDPSDSEWAKATGIAFAPVARVLGGIEICGRPLECAMANATVSPVDVIVDAEATS